MPKETKHVVINNRKDAMEFMTKCFETYLGAAEAGDAKVMRQQWSHMEQINQATDKEIRDRARLVDDYGNPVKVRGPVNGNVPGNS